MSDHVEVGFKIFVKCAAYLILTVYQVEGSGFHDNLRVFGLLRTLWMDNIGTQTISPGKFRWRREKGGVSEKWSHQ